MSLLPVVKDTPDKIRIFSNNHSRLTDILGIPRKKTKDLEGTAVLAFNIEIDTNHFVERLLRDKSHRKCELIAAMFNETKYDIT